MEHGTMGLGARVGGKPPISTAWVDPKLAVGSTGRDHVTTGAEEILWQKAGRQRQTQMVKDDRVRP